MGWSLIPHITLLQKIGNKKIKIHKKLEKIWQIVDQKITYKTLL
jgi:hypothetical protein